MTAGGWLSGIGIDIYDSLDPAAPNGCPTAANFGNGSCQILTPTYTIDRTSNSVSWTSHGSGPIADRPSAALFGVGEWLTEGREKSICDGISWKSVGTALTKVSYAVFDGVTSKVTLPKTYKLESDGDYIEFVAKVMEIQSVGGSVLGMIGVAGTNVDYIGPSSTSGNFAIRDHTGVNQNLPISITGYTGYDWHRYRLTQTSAILWTLTVDGTEIGTLARGTEIWFDNIGQGYSTTYCTHAMKEITISTTLTGNLKITDFSTQLVDKKLTYTSGVTFEEFHYVAGDVIALANHVSIEWVNVYVPQEKSTKFIKYLYQNTIDGAKAADVYRIKSAYIATPIEAPLIWGVDRIITTSTGEWENAVYIADQTDFFGGSSHGKDEKVAGSNTMLIDGVAKPITTFIAGSGSKVEFNQVSNCYKKVGTDFRSVHVADSVRKWEFTAAGLDISNKLTWLTSEVLSSAYLAMVPILRSDVTSNLTEWGLWGESPVPVDISVSGFTIVENVGVPTLAMFGDTAGLHVKSEVVLGFTKPTALTWIANDVTYNKFYFDFTGAAYTTAVGEVMDTKTRHIIKLTV
ncbi:MAG: hypothetical protein WC714_28610 [Candidatus Obscuribacterales bacterium]|jgi:hypothetical protein